MLLLSSRELDASVDHHYLPERLLALGERVAWQHYVPAAAPMAGRGVEPQRIHGPTGSIGWLWLRQRRQPTW